MQTREGGMFAAVMKCVGRYVPMKTAVMEVGVAAPCKCGCGRGLSVCVEITNGPMLLTSRAAAEKAIAMIRAAADNVWPAQGGER